MIWLIMGILVLGTLLVVTAPLYKKHAPSVVQDHEVAEYLRQITDVEVQIETVEDERSKSALNAAKVDLQRQLLKRQQQVIPSLPNSLLLSSLFIAFAFGALGLYATFGSPELSHKTALKAPTMAPQQAIRQSAGADSKHESGMTLENAVIGLEKKLAKDGSDPQGWMLYARSLMSLRRFDDAIGAYEKVLLLTNNNPNVRKEFESAKAYITQQGEDPASQASGPSAEQMRDAQAMTPQDRQDMIQGMVDGLAQKLVDNPNDPDGWVKLFRARKVLGQDETITKEIVRMRAAFKGKPALQLEILAAAGLE